MVWVFLFSIPNGYSQSPDSGEIRKNLLEALRKKPLDRRNQMELYIDLHDLSDNDTDRSIYIREALSLAIQLKDQSYIFETLDILCRLHKNVPDSLNCYQQVGKKCLTGPYKDFYMAWLKAYPSVCKMDEAEKPDEANKEIAYYKKHKADLSNRPEELQWEMIMCSAMECLNYFSPSSVFSEDRIIHLKNIQQLIDNLPFEVCYKFNWYYLTRVEFIYRSEGGDINAAKAVDALEKIEQLYDRQFELPFFKRRTYYSVFRREELRVGVYSEMLFFGNIIGQKRLDSIYSQMKEFYRKHTSKKDRKLFLSSSFFYYLYSSQYDKAMQTVDEMLLQTDSADINRQSELLANKIDLVTRWGQHYKEGFEAFWKYNALMEQNRVEETNRQLAEMRSLFEVDKLKMEQAELQARYHGIALIVVLVFSLIFFTWGLYQYWLKKRLKVAQLDLLQANKKVAEESERAKASDRMKTEFLQSMSHEIRTPLNSISGFSALLLDEDVDMEEKKNFPAIIEKNSRQLIELFESILHMSDLSSSLDLFPMEQIDILPVCLDVAEAYQVKADKLGFKCVLNTTGDKCLIKTNAIHLQHALEHLLNNAMKFADSGVIGMGLVHLEGKVRICVTDTGISIPEDKAEYIFDRFTKLDEFTPGIGLGLYSCRLILNRLGGTIYLDTSYKDGARFCMELPDNE